MDPVALLTKNRKDILKALASISPQAAELVDQLEQNDSALAPMSAPPSKYTGVKKVRDALRELFAEKGRPLTEDEIKDEIVNKGGFRRGDPPSIRGSRLVVQKSIKLHMNGDGRKTWPLKRINGLIGPADWDDSRFVER